MSDSKNSIHKIEVIAEIANAHQGDPELARELAHRAFEAGADAIKFQIYFAHELLVKSHPKYDHFKKQSFLKKTWDVLLSEQVKAGRKVYCDVFGFEALEIASNNEIFGVKVHSSDLGNLPLIEKIANIKKRTLLAVGGSTAFEISCAIEVFKKNWDSSVPMRENLVLLHGFQSYPTQVEDSCLSRIPWLAKHFGKYARIGYMDHVDGDDPFSFSLPLMAVGMGAQVIEKHITLDRSAKGVDYYSSANPDEFKSFVKMVRRAEKALNAQPEAFSEQEKVYQKTAKKYWVTSRPLKAGTILSETDLVMKRVSNVDLHFANLNQFVGKKLLSSLSEESVIRRSNVEQKVWALVVARMKSARLPGKALMELGGGPALQHLFKRLKQAKKIDHVVFCTTTESEDDALVELAKNAGVAYHRGPVEDVLGRMLGAIEGREVDAVLRVTGDDLLVDPEYADRAIEYHFETNSQYSDLKALPSGTEVEVFDAELLQKLWKIAADADGTEYLTTYIVSQKDQFRVSSVPVDPRHQKDWRLTLDTPEDYQVIEQLLTAMGQRGKATTYRLDDIVDFFEASPGTLKLNAMVRQRQTPPQVCTDLKWARLIDDK